jgi:hypothetical protein
LDGYANVGHSSNNLEVIGLDVRCTPEAEYEVGSADEGEEN